MGSKKFPKGETIKEGPVKGTTSTNAGFEILTAVCIKSSIFWDIKLYLLSASCWFLAWLIFDPEDRGDVIVRNVS
jgi:hypothetical protein